jgi:hypothetical protein
MSVFLSSVSHAREEGLDFHAGMLIAHVTTQLQTVNRCGKKFPEHRAGFNKIGEMYLQLISPELLLLKEATDKYVGFKGAFNSFWQESLSLSDVVDAQFNAASTDMLRQMCGVMASDIINGKFRGTPILLRPLSLAEPAAWKLLNDYLAKSK